jgi:hypothetical protein
MTWIETFVKARSCGTPLVAINTFDPAATVSAISEIESDAILVQWDIQRGFSGLNKKGEQAVHHVQPPDFPANDPSMALNLALKFEPNSVLFFHNADALLTPDLQGLTAVQGFWNLRDPFKSDDRCAVLLCADVLLPGRLEGDILVIEEALPTPEVLAQVLNQCLSDARAAKEDYPLPDEEAFSRAIDALRGLSVYPAEQAVSMSLTNSGLCVNSLWNRKREKIKQTAGLAVFDGDENYSSIGGCEQVKKFLQKLLHGPDSPRVIVFIDEIEKALAGAVGGDTSGVSQEMHGTLLSYMQDKRSLGTLFLGPPGAAKSAIAKATGNEAGLLTIVFDLSSMKGSLVGESNANLKRALKVIDAVSDGKAMFIATCNSIANLSPELRRRFTAGTFFFDLPTKEEREKIWQIYCQKYGVERDETLNDSGWTGAEIERCCEFAWRLSVTVTESAEYIVPVSVSDGQRIEGMRQEASGKYLSASHAGPYRYETEPEITKPAVRVQANRKMQF